MSGRIRRLSYAGAAGLLLALAGAATPLAAPAPKKTQGQLQATVASAPPPSSKQRGQAAPDFAPGEIVVRFREGLGTSAVNRVADRLKLRHKRSVRGLGASVLGLGRGQTVAGRIAMLERQPEVVYAEPNYLYQLQATPNDPRYPDLWGMNQPSDADIDAPEAWDLHTGTAGTTVAVMDTGMAYDHPDLAPNVWSNPGETGGGKETNGVDDDGNGYVDDHRGWNFYALNEAQEVAITGAPTGGTFTLTFDGETTANIDYNASAADVENALVGLPGLDPGDVLALDGPLPGTPVLVVFLELADQPQMTATPSLTGGASPAVVLTTIQDGAAQDNDPRDYEGHGSHVAGTIGAQGDNATNVAGVNWDVSLINLRVCGPLGCPEDAIAAAMAYAGEIVGGAPRARVANGSFGGPGFSQLLLDAINGAPQTLFVFAAGNDGLDNDTSPNASYPCAYADGTTIATNTENNILCVAASNPADGLAGFSNFGAATVDLAAPGVGVLSTFIDLDPVWQDDLETAGTWTTGGVNDTWARTTENAGAPFGPNALTDSPGASYLNGTNSFARRTSTFDLTGKKGCALIYALDLDLAGGDALHLEWTTDGATWNSVPFGPWFGPGSSSGFFFSAEPLGVEDAANVNFRWRLQSDSNLAADGAWIDAVEVSCVASTYDESDATFLSGTSMASPHVAGAAALLYSYSTTLSPALASPLTPSQLKKIVMESVDPVAAFATTTASGGRLNLHNMLAGGFCASGGVSLPATHIGTAGNNVLNGTTGADVMTGLAGIDQIDGGGGDDVLCGGLGNDTLVGAAGNDDLFGGAGNDHLAGRADNDDLDGGPGGDVAYFGQATGGVTASLVTGLASGEGADTLAGVEHLSGSAHADSFTGDAGPNILYGLGGADSLVGGDSDDQLYGGEGDDPLLDGGNGNDVIEGAGGVDQLLGGEGSDLLRGGLGDDSGVNGGVSGGNGNDQIFGGDGVDELMGDGGNDVLQGGVGNDDLFGGADDDHLAGNAGDDDLDGGTGADTAYFDQATGGVTASLVTGAASGEGADTLTGLERLSGSPHADTLTGDGGQNILTGLGGADTLVGGDGDDQLFGGGDNDPSLSGGQGNDLIEGGAGTDILLGGEDPDLLRGGLGDDGLDGGGGPDLLFGDDGADQVVGGAGDDQLQGGAGNDDLFGGDGNDYLAGGADNDDFDGGPGSDTGHFGQAPAGVTASLATGTATGEGADTLTALEHLSGSPYPDMLSGDTGANILYGLGGADQLTGGDGDDQLYGGDDPDLLDGGLGDDLLEGGAGMDTLFGGDGADLLRGGLDDDQLVGGAGNDDLYGDDGDDQLAGSAGDDFLDGGAGSDTARFDQAVVGVIASLALGTAGGEGVDTLTGLERLSGSPHADTLTGDGGPNILTGLGDADTLAGDDGDDELYGGEGDDPLLDGGGDDDLIDGGPGTDTCANGETVVNCELP